MVSVEGGVSGTSYTTWMIPLFGSTQNPSLWAGPSNNFGALPISGSPSGNRERCRVHQQHWSSWGLRLIPSWQQLRLPQDKLVRLHTVSDRRMGGVPCVQKMPTPISLGSLESWVVSTLRLPVPSTIVTSDASGNWGCGAFSGSHWFQLAWPDCWAEVHITAKELVPIVLQACYGDTSGQNSQFILTDNMAVEACLKSGTSLYPPLSCISCDAYGFCQHSISSSSLHNTSLAIETLRLMLSPGTKGLFFSTNNRPTENLKSSQLPWWTCCWSPSWTGHLQPGHLCSVVLFGWNSTSYSKVYASANGRFLAFCQQQFNLQSQKHYFVSMSHFYPCNPWSTSRSSPTFQLSATCRFPRHLWPWDIPQIRICPEWDLPCPPNSSYQTPTSANFYVMAPLDLLVGLPWAPLQREEYYFRLWAWCERNL